MKELLTKLQACSKTWERFAEYVMTNFGIAEQDLLNPVNDTPAEIRMVQIALNGFLPDFCDGEGYFICPKLKFKSWIAAIYDKEGFEVPVILPFSTSRQEAFEAGVIKAFELMETKEDK